MFIRNRKNKITKIKRTRRAIPLVMGRNEGSMVLEAAIIMPIFLCFMLFLVTMVRIALVDMTLQHAVGEATKQAAAHMYILDQSYDSFRQIELGNNEEEKDDLVKEQLQHWKRKMTEENRELTALIEFSQELLEGNHEWPKTEDQVNSVAVRFFQPLVDKHMYHAAWINLERVMITQVHFPNITDKADPYFGLELRYDMTLPIPFLYKTIHFHHHAYERVWVGNDYYDELLNPPAKEDGDQDLEEGLRIISITSPVQRGRGVTVIARGSENRTAKIRLYYRSGFQKEESCSSNHQGWFHCDIRIGGNSNEGEFLAVMTVNHLEDRATFIVLSKDNMKRYIEERKRNANPNNT